jgi:uncharacterized iron-regulated membrane protein
MEPTFRAAMNWLHTWAGVVLGGLLFAIFWMGTLSVFDREIDRWMMPATRLALPDEPIPLDAFRPYLETAAAANARAWAVVPATEREPLIHVTWQDAKATVSLLLDPATGAVLSDPGTWAGTRFIYPFHYMLQIGIGRLGAWIVAFASMAMLALCVSGVIIHRKIFVDFFTFRAGKKQRRAILDLHNLTGVLALPFHVAITLSGLIIFYSIYFSAVLLVVYGDNGRARFRDDAPGIVRQPRSGHAGNMASLGAMAEEASRLWGGSAAGLVIVWHPGDAAGYVQIRRSSDDVVAFPAGEIYFDPATGKLLPSHKPLPVASAQHFIAGLHLIHFRHWTLRWLYFALGLAGCVMIATGYLFWLESRRKRHASLGFSGVRIVEGLTIGSVSGIMIATLSFFVVNRLLPLGTAFAGYDRAALEIWTFYLVWLATFGHAWLRQRRAWIEQCWTLAALAVAAVLLNWLTTGDHLLRSLVHHHLWAVAGMDLLMLVGAVVAALTATRLRPTPPVRAKAATAPARAAPPPARDDCGTR